MLESLFTYEWYNSRYIHTDDGQTDGIVSFRQIIRVVGVINLKKHGGEGFYVCLFLKGGIMEIK